MLADRIRTSLGIVLGVLALGGSPSAQAQPTPPPALPAEESDVAVLAPAGPHRLFLQDTYGLGVIHVVDIDGDKLNVMGAVPMARGGVGAVASDGSRLFVAETIYTKLNRGDRQDLLSIYDGKTLNQLKEIVIPGRLQVVPKAQTFDLSADDKLAYVYDMFPASQVYAVDLEQGKVISTIDLPGCALAFPYGPRSFATLCGDGTVGVATVPAGGGEAKAVFSKPFFAPDEDPIFEHSVVDDSTGNGYFLSFTGRIHPVTFGDRPVVGQSWTIAGAAGLPEVGPDVQQLAWRPGGGGQVMALHRASRHLFVLMHPGTHWTHKDAGTELWELDATTRRLVRRIKLDKPASSVVVTQDAAPLLYLFSDGPDLSAYNALTGEKLGRRKLAGDLGWTTTR